MNRIQRRQKRAIRLRRRLSLNMAGSLRLAFFKSNSHIEAQLIDDSSGVTLYHVSTLSFKDRVKLNVNKALSSRLGKFFVEHFPAQYKESSIIFDRGGYLYASIIDSFAQELRVANIIV